MQNFNLTIEYTPTTTTLNHQISSTQLPYACVPVHTQGNKKNNNIIWLGPLAQERNKEEQLLKDSMLLNVFNESM